MPRRSCPARRALNSPTLEQILSGVVHIKTFINPDGRTAENLGKERDGTGIVIDSDGLVLTIGYLMVEALSAEIIDCRWPHHGGERGRLR